MYVRSSHRSFHRAEARLELTKPGTEYVRTLGTYASYEMAKLDAVRAQATAELATLMTKHVARLVSEAPASAVVTIDGHRVARAEGPVLVAAGEHTVVVTPDGKDDRRAVCATRARFTA